MKESKQFQTNISTYYNILTFRSFGVTYDKTLTSKNNDIYTFYVQAQMYHFINDFISSNKKSKNLQPYFFNNKNELRNQMTRLNKLNENIVLPLVNILKLHNSHSIFLKSLTNIVELSDFCFSLKYDVGLDQ